MTKFPTESRQIEGLEGQGYESYRVGPTCSSPGCSKFADHAHHLFSRGMMGGAYDWVRLPDGTETGNTVPLCYHHHQRVTDNEVHITYETGKFLWEGQPLSWQPPVKEGTVASQLEPVEQAPEKPVCGECGRALPRPKLDTPIEEKKARKTWAVAVPYTHEEDGADTLDALLEAAREQMDTAGLNWGEGHKVKFHILTTALALFVQNGDAILSNEPVSAQSQ